MSDAERFRLQKGDLVFLWNRKKGDAYQVRVTPGATQGTHMGQIKHDDLLGASYGDTVLTHKGEPFCCLRPTIGEYARRIKRETQIVFPKDAGYILQHLNVQPGSTVLECGTGSGSLCCIFAHFVGASGRVVTYDKRGEFTELARKNAERWGVEGRIEFKTRSLDGGFDERDADAVFIDLPQPWGYIGDAWNALAPGNRLGILVPTFNQIAETLEEIERWPFADVQVLELLMRFLKTDPRRIRPEDIMVGHTGYLIFAAKIQPFASGDPGEEKADAEVSGDPDPVEDSGANGEES